MPFQTRPVTSWNGRVASSFPAAATPMRVNDFCVSEVLGGHTIMAAVDADWDKSRQYGVTGVPTYVAGGYGVVGAQPYEVLEKLMQEVGAQKR